MEPSSHGPTPTIGLVCPLSLELQAIKLIFDGGRVEERLIYNNDELENIYYYGRIGDRVAVALKFASQRLGPQEATFQAQKLLNRHDTLRHANSFCFLVGVAAGIWDEKNDVRLGDVVIATQVVDWTSGKVNTGNEFESTEHAHDITEEMLQRVDEFVHNQARLGKRIQRQMKSMLQKLPSEEHTHWQHPGSEHDVLFKSHVRHVSGNNCQACVRDVEARVPRESALPRVHRGLIAAGAVVLKDAETREQLRGYRHKRVLAVEMEASGVLTAHKHFIIIRGICDYADAHKNKRWQNHAALKAAACLRVWLDEYVVGHRAVAKQPQLVKVDYPRRLLSERQPNDTRLGPANLIKHLQSRPSTSLPTKSSSRPPKDMVAAPNADSLGKLEIDLNNNNAGSNIANSNLPNTGQIQESNEVWQPALTVGCLRADIEISNVNIRGGVESATWTNSTLALELRNDPDDAELGYSGRRLRIISEDHEDRFIWLPHTRIRTQRQEATVELVFSNCNRREHQRSGPYTSIGGHITYTTKYNPNDPNVTMKVEVINETQADELCQHVLLQNRDFSKWAVSPAETFSFCTITWRIGSPRRELDECLLVWYTENDQHELDLGGFADRMDFDIYTSGRAFHLFLGYMIKLNYKPVDNSTYKAEPPRKVRENHQGRPGDTTFSGRDQAESGLVLVVEEGQIQDALNRTVRRIVKWGVKFFATDVQIRLRHKRRPDHNKFVKGQVSVWTKAERTRLLFRIDEPERNDMYQWMMCFPCKPRDTFHITNRGEKKGSVISEIELKAGDFLSKTNFEPAKDNDKCFVNGKPSQVAWDKVKLEWPSAGHKQAFEQLL